MRPRAPFALAVTCLLLLAACEPRGEDTAGDTSVAKALQLELGDELTDNGYGDATIGVQLAKLKSRYPNTIFETEKAFASCKVVRPSTSRDLEFTVDNERIVRVDVVGPSIRTVGGGHRVGESAATVETTYEERIRQGAKVSLDRSNPTRLVVSARDKFRLVFESSSDGRVRRIYSTVPERVAEQCPTDALPSLTLDAFVPPNLDGVPRRERDPSLAKVLGMDPLFELAWDVASEKWKAAAGVDLIDKAVGCLYEADAATIGVYAAGGPAPRLILVAVLKPARIGSIAFAACIAREAAGVVLSQPYEPRVCVAAYRAPAVDGTYLVAYAVAGRFDADSNPCRDICVELPECDGAPPAVGIRS